MTNFLFQIIVLHVGTNNVSNAPEEVAEGISEIVKSVREKLAEVYVVLTVSTHYSTQSAPNFHSNLSNLFICLSTDAIAARPPIKSATRETRAGEQAVAGKVFGRPQQRQGAMCTNRQRPGASGWHY